MLARCCLRTELDSCPDDGLAARMVQQCASECIVTSRQMISIVSNHHMHGTGVLPAWWYRMFYIHTAATVLAVSGLRPDLFPISETCGAWESAIGLFQAHEHLSESVRICKVALQKIHSKIQRTQDDSARDPSHGISTTLENFPDLFQDFALPIDDNSFFNIDSTSWLTNEEIWI
jgi:hypothetical protein